MWLTSLSIRRPVFILMVMLTFMVLGFYSYSRMKVELQPNVDFPVVTVVTAYPGAGPEEIETLVSKRIEDAVGSASGVKEVSSTSREGLSLVVVEFELGTNLDTAFTDVRSKVDSIRSEFPTDVESPSISKIDTRASPVMFIGVSSPRTSAELRDLVDDRLTDRLGRVKGVASVNVTGGDIREILIALRPDSLVAMGLTPAEVLNALRTATLNLPAGHVVEGNREYSIRFFGEFQTVEEIKNLQINLPNKTGGEGPGPAIRLADVAEITDTVEERRTTSRLNSQNSVTMVIQKASDANTVDVATGIRAELANLKAQYSDLVFTISQDQAKVVKESLDDLRISLFLGIFLVVLIVYLFLHNLRGTIIVSLAIPTSMLATFIVMYFAGFTVNMMTMMALSLSVGILVDDAIVVLENIYRHLTKGETPIQAAINGRSEIGTAAITITLIDVVVFLPIAFMGGITGQFFRAFGITVASATLFSLFVSFTITPMLASRWYREGEILEQPHGFFLILENRYRALARAYRAILAWALSHRWLVILIGYGALLFVFNVIGGSFQTVAAAVTNFTKTVIVPWGAIAVVLTLISLLPRQGFLRRGALGIAALGVALAFANVLGASFGKPLLNFRFAPEQDQGSVSIQVTMPAGASLTATDNVIRQIESVVTKYPDADYTTALVGSWTSGFFGAGNSGPRYGEVQVTLREKVSFGERLFPFLRHEPRRTKSDQLIAGELREAVGTFPGALVTVNAVSGFAGFGAPIQISLSGDNIATLTDAAERTKRVLADIPGILNPDTSWTAGQPEYRAKIDRDRANNLGVSAMDAALNLRIAFAGNTDVKFRVNGKEYPIRVRLAEAQRNDLRSLGTVPVAYRNSGPIFLSSISDIERHNSPTKIDRKDRNRQVMVTAYLKPGFSPGNMRLVIDKAFADLQLPPPRVSLAWEGENRVQEEESQYMMSALMLAMILVYILMASLFDNMLTPFVIMLSQPQALVGALLALILTGAGLSIVAMIGVIMLIGLVGKNAILLLDYTNTLRKRGMPRHEALLEAGPTRLRPILMTSVAMILGMLPVALGIGRGSEFRSPLGIAVIGGLILSTGLTLIVIPCAYTLVDDFSDWIGRKLFRRTSRVEAPKPDGAVAPTVVE